MNRQIATGESPRAGLADPLLDKAEVACAIHGTTRTAEHLHRTGQCKGIVIGGRLLWRLSAVERFVAEREGGVT